MNVDKLVSIYIGAIRALGDSEENHDQITLLSARIIRGTLDDIFPPLKLMAMYRDETSGKWTVASSDTVTPFASADEAVDRIAAMIRAAVD